MPSLDLAIEKIHCWLRDNAPDHEALLQKPLTRQQIDDLVGPWRHLLPEEAYTLYGWRNGMAGRQCLIPGYEFPSLADALCYATGGDEFLDLVGPQEYGTLPIFPTQHTSGGYDLICDTHSQFVGPVDYEKSAVTDSLTELLTMLSNLFEDGSITMSDGEPDFVDGPVMIGLDRDECYHRLLEEDWEEMSQAALRIGFEIADSHDPDFAMRKSLDMFRNPASRVWREPLIQEDLMIHLNFSSDPHANRMMAHLLRHPEQRIRWRAAALVGNSQYFHRYAWMSLLAEYFLEELSQPDLPPAYSNSLILCLGKTGDHRAVPFLRELQDRRLDNTSLVAGLCLKHLKDAAG